MHTFVQLQYMYTLDTQTSVILYNEPLITLQNSPKKREIHFHKSQTFTLHGTVPLYYKQYTRMYLFVVDVHVYCMYRIFRGRKLSQIGGKMEFYRENFRGLNACTYCVDRAFKQSRRKLSLIGIKQQNLRNFSPSKVSLYTVCTC